jgi:UDP-N-acetylglucosamine--N-acetylmuramyl-(pentapeptide) pyrophosphoryl-undecaprenol N-acetylglucosamine transferase
MSTAAPLVMLAAGGTGGHLFPAQALAEELVARGLRTQLVTDERVRDYGKDFPAEKTHIVEAATLTPKKPWKVPFQVYKIFAGKAHAKRIFQAERPAAVVGFGGYPSFAPLQAATQMNIAALVHEQNAVLGRANTMLSAKVDALATSFPETFGITSEVKDRVMLTGNPVRALVMQSRAAAYPQLRSGGPLRLVVFGGSQGARFFSEFMPKVLLYIEPALRARLHVVQQCRTEDLASTKALYDDLGIAHELQAFFMDMPQRIAQSHLVISRSGASTIAELGVVGRPAVMVPLPGALDNDQLRNAQSFAAAGAGWVREQAQQTPEDFAKFITGLLLGGLTLPAAAAKALLHGKPDAAKRLADLVQKTIAAKAAALQGIQKA